MAKKLEVPHLKETRKGEWELHDPASPKKRRRGRKLKVLLVVIAVASCALLAFAVRRTVIGPAPTASAGPVVATCEAYQQVQNGMTLEDVQRIVGAAPSSNADFQSSNLKASDYSWSGRVLFSSMSVWLDQSGRVESKSQYNLC